jgi:pimeloyl-ACP methyl ester carboxylesterase
VLRKRRQVVDEPCLEVSVVRREKELLRVPPLHLPVVGATQPGGVLAGLRVVALDLRGHGVSDKPEQEYTVAGFTVAARTAGSYRGALADHHIDRRRHDGPGRKQAGGSVVL